MKESGRLVSKLELKGQLCKVARTATRGTYLQGKSGSARCTTGGEPQVCSSPKLPPHLAHKQCLQQQRVRLVRVKEKKHWSAMTSFTVGFYSPSSLRAFKVPQNAPRAITLKFATISRIVRYARLVTVPSSVVARVIKERSGSAFAGANDGLLSRGLSLAASRLSRALAASRLSRGLSLAASRLTDGRDTQ